MNLFINKLHILVCQKPKQPLQTSIQNGNEIESMKKKLVEIHKKEITKKIWYLKYVVEHGLHGLRSKSPAILLISKFPKKIYGKIN